MGTAFHFSLVYERHFATSIIKSKLTYSLYALVVGLYSFGPYFDTSLSNLPPSVEGGLFAQMHENKSS